MRQPFFTPPGPAPAAFSFCRDFIDKRPAWLTLPHMAKSISSAGGPPALVTPSPKVSGREIWALTWPQVIMMLFQFMIGFTDVWVAGRISSPVQAALGVVTQVFFFLLVIGTAISVSSVAAISQSLGARRRLRAQRYLGLVFNLGVVCCIATLIAGFALSRQIMHLMQVPGEILPITDELWSIFLLTIPGQYAMIFSSAAFRASKRVIIPLYTSMLVFLVNVFLDFGLGLGHFGMPNLGARGLALGTLISTLCGAAFNIFCLTRIGLLSRKSFAPLRWQKKAAPYLAKVALPAGGNQFSWQLGYMVLFAITAGIPWDSVNTLAGMNAGMRIESILFLPAFAFSSTGAVLVGHYLGAGLPAEAKKVGLRVLFIGAGLMTFMAACMWPFTEELAAFMTPDPDAQVHAVRYIRFNLISTPFTIGSMTLGGILSGAGATIYTFIVYSAATWLIRLPLAWYMGYRVWESSSGIFFAMPVSQFFQCSIILIIFLRGNWTRFAMRKAHPQK